MRGTTNPLLRGREDVRKGGIIAGGIIAIVGLFRMFVNYLQFFRGANPPFGGVVYTYIVWTQLGFYILVLGLIILIASAVMPDY